MGNETRIDEEKFNNDIRYYNARYVQYIFYPEITRRSRSGGHEYTIGGGYQSVNVRSDLNDINEEQDRFIDNTHQMGRRTRIADIAGFIHAAGDKGVGAF